MYQAVLDFGRPHMAPRMLGSLGKKWTVRVRVDARWLACTLRRLSFSPAASRGSGRESPTFTGAAHLGRRTVARLHFKEIELLARRLAWKRTGITNVHESCSHGSAHRGSLALFAQDQADVASATKEVASTKWLFPRGRASCAYVRARSCCRLHF